MATQRYETIMIGEVYTYICTRCGSVAWQQGSHDAWHEFVKEAIANLGKVPKELHTVFEISEVPQSVMRGHNMASLLVHLELVLHDVDCPGHDEGFEGHGDKYTKMAKAALALLPPDREPYWLTDRKLVQESSLSHLMAMQQTILDRLREISNRVGA